MSLALRIDDPGYEELLRRQAKAWTVALEAREAERSGLTLAEARPIVARKLLSTPGTLENLRRNRIKRVAHSLYKRLHNLVLRELEKEVRRLEHEIQLHRQAGLDPREDEVLAAQTALVAAREALGAAE